MGKLSGRPRKQVDPELLERLSACGCTVNEMAAVMQCSKRTLERRFAAAVEAGRMRGRSSLRHKQFQLAMRGDKTMLVWLGKQYLGQNDGLLISRRQLQEFVTEMIAAIQRRVVDPAVQQQVNDDWMTAAKRVFPDV